MNDPLTQPLISIGMPVRNEARFIQAALESLTGQAGVRVEILLSDNASSDATADICKDYANRFPFIRYHRFEQNVGATENFHYVLREAKGEYFIWASGHDCWQDNYLFECARLLQNNQGAVIAFGSTHWIDSDGLPHARATGWNDTRGLGLTGRYFTVFWGNMNPIIALIRVSALRTQKIESMTGGDLALLLALALQGDFVHAPATNWYRREFRNEATYGQKLERYRSGEFALTKTFWARCFPLARLPVRIVSDLFRSRIRLRDKVLIFMVLLPSLLVKFLTGRQLASAAAGHGNRDRPA